MKFKSLIGVVGCFFLLNSVGFAEPAQKTVVVGPDDTVYGVAYNNGIPTRSLISANNLKPPYTLKVGQTLIIPMPSQHIVGKGETSQSIAETYGVNVDVLAQENNITNPSYIAPGTALIIPSRDTTTMTKALKPQVEEEISTSSLTPLPLVKTELTPLREETFPVASASNAGLPDDLAKELAAEKTEITAPPLMENLAEKKDKKPVAKAEKKKEKKVTKKSETEKKTSKEVAFDWPVKGEVISSFSPGDKNDGINIKVPEGTPVKAAADGTVMYAGNELKGFGNLLLIKHRDGWVTAYAHNSDLLVKKGDKVVQGQAIAKSGTPDAIKKGDVPEPQLHFEIRKVKQPVDPLTKLKS